MLKTSFESALIFVFTNEGHFLSFNDGFKQMVMSVWCILSCCQTLHKSSSRGECHVVDSEVITSGIPYQDYFYTVHRYCLTSVNKHKSRLR